jgi:cell wall-associated NlpC family hydrolase
MRLPRPLLLALVPVALAAAGTGAVLASAPAGAHVVQARIAPVPSPLPVPAVLEQAAQRLEREAAAAKPAAPTTRHRTASRVQDPLAAGGPRGSDAVLARADVLANGIALPPLDAPDEVRAIIEAGNAIARTPYKWGGGHGRWLDTGYDCSGSVSFALASAGLLSGPMASGPLMSWGEAGEGRWITVWSKSTHVFLVVAGVRFDTSGTRVTGSRWQATMRSTAGFVARHPPGL